MVASTSFAVSTATAGWAPNCTWETRRTCPSSTSVSFVRALPVAVRVVSSVTDALSFWRRGLSSAEATVSAMVPVRVAAVALPSLLLAVTVRVSGEVTPLLPPPWVFQSAGRRSQIVLVAPSPMAPALIEAPPAIKVPSVALDGCVPPSWNRAPFGRPAMV